MQQQEVKPNIEYGFTKDQAHRELDDVEAILESVVVLVRDLQTDVHNVKTDLYCSRLTRVEVHIKKLQDIAGEIKNHRLRSALEKVQRCMVLRSEFINGGA